MADFELVRCNLVSPYLDAADCRLPIDRERPAVITTNFSDTEIKLAECEFFLNLIEQNANHQAVMYFGLSAFLASVRSVTLYLQAEGCKSEEFVEWYASVRERLKDDEVARFLKDLRDEALHARYSLIKTVFDLPLYKAAEGWVHNPAGGIYVGFSFPQYLFENGLKKCRAFVDSLRTAVQEARAHGFLPTESPRNVTMEFRDVGKSRTFAPVAVEQTAASDVAPRRR